ncbi:MAG TPA: caspase family protein [Thermoanaerobaculia bacterium]|nr:caspase family protein [Thermoanaerobaculia bacterium]
MRRALVFLLALAFLAPGWLRGEEISAEPILRVETGMHTAHIESIFTDSAGHFLVTGSRDKTVRVWDLASGNLLRILRPRIGPGRQGDVYAVAISPDGGLIAAAVYTAPISGTSIYLFERSTGRIMEQIWRIPQIVSRLEFSPDGKLLAMLLREEGIRLFQISGGREVGRDVDYQHESYGLDFDSSGRLVTSCYDGFLRLYDSNLKRLAILKAPGGARPYKVSFSPDGRKVGVIYNDSTQVDVVSGSDLRWLYSATKGARSPLGVEWSRDERFLYVATGGAVRRWTEAGRGASVDLGVAGVEIFHIASLSGGRLAFSTLGPGWGVLNPDGDNMVLRATQSADFRQAGDRFRTDSSGSLVQFGFEPRGKLTATFSVQDRSFIASSVQDTSLIPPRTKDPNFKLYDWTPSSDPNIAGQALEWERFETPLSLSINPDQKSFLIGSHWTLRYCELSGKLLWTIPSPAPVVAANLSGDGRLALAAFFDGTIRWFRTEDGQELLALFPHADRRRWVVWTPSGYYDVSTGSEELIGEHVNRGPDKIADWYPASSFRDRFYRPDVIARILKTRDEAKALAEADAEVQRSSQVAAFQLQPPVVTLLDGTGEVEARESILLLRVVVRSPSGEPITSVRTYVDGQLVGATRGLEFEGVNISPIGTGKAYAIEVPLPPRDCTVAILAETRLATSEPSLIKVRWVADPPVPEKPTLYVLAVGVGAYKNPDFKLELPAKDARDMVSVWKHQEGGLYEKVEIRLLTDKDATRDAILSGLEWLETQVTQRDVAVLFFAGHGVNDPRTGGYQFLPYEADLNARRTTLLPDREVISTLSGLPGKVLVFLDTCHSGNLLGGLKTRDTSDLNRLINELASADNGVVVFAASTGRQRSAESPEWKNGVFTKAVVEALDGKADLDGDHSIWITEIESYVGKRLKELTGGLQTPVSLKPGGVPDFPIAVTGRP